MKALNNQSNELSEYSIDERLSDMLITKTLGEIAKLAQCTNHTKTEVVCTLIYNAVFGSVAEARAGIFNPDIGLMEEIIKRVDGSVPDAKERENFANIIGEALDDVMELPKEQARWISFDDPCIITFAKTIVSIAMDQTVGKNPIKKKDRQVATRILLDRCGGRKNEPTSENTKVIEVNPSWEKQLN